MNGLEPQFTDAVGKVIPRPLVPPLVASPINLLNPDRYEFYTFDDNGDLIKRLMTMKEIQSIVANGNGAMGVDNDADSIVNGAQGVSQVSETKVQDIVDSVQSVLTKEMETQKNVSDIQLMLDTPDVSSSWSMILPAIFGNNGEEIMPAKPLQSSINMTPDAEIMEVTQPVKKTTKVPSSTKKPKPVSTSAPKPLISRSTTTERIEVSTQVEVSSESIEKTLDTIKPSVVTRSTTKQPTTIKKVTQKLKNKLTPLTTIKPVLTTQGTTQKPIMINKTVMKPSIIQIMPGRKPGSVPLKTVNNSLKKTETTKKPVPMIIRTSAKPVVVVTSPQTIQSFGTTEMVESTTLEQTTNLKPTVQLKKRPTTNVFVEQTSIVPQKIPSSEASEKLKETLLTASLIKGVESMMNEPEKPIMIIASTTTVTTKAPEVTTVTTSFDKKTEQTVKVKVHPTESTEQFSVILDSVTTVKNVDFKDENEILDSNEAIDNDFLLEATTIFNSEEDRKETLNSMNQIIGSLQGLMPGLFENKIGTPTIGEKFIETTTLPFEEETTEGSNGKLKNSVAEKISNSFIENKLFIEDEEPTVHEIPTTTFLPEDEKTDSPVTEKLEANTLSAESNNNEAFKINKNSDMMFSIDKLIKDQILEGSSQIKIVVTPDNDHKMQTIASTLQKGNKSHQDLIKEVATVASVMAHEIKEPLVTEKSDSVTLKIVKMEETTLPPKIELTTKLPVPEVVTKDILSQSLSSMLSQIYNEDPSVVKVDTTNLDINHFLSSPTELDSHEKFNQLDALSQLKSDASSETDLGSFESTTLRDIIEENGKIETLIVKKTTSVSVPKTKPTTPIPSVKFVKKEPTTQKNTEDSKAIPNTENSPLIKTSSLKLADEISSVKSSEILITERPLENVEFSTFFLVDDATEMDATEKMPEFSTEQYVVSEKKSTNRKEIDKVTDSPIVKFQEIEKIIKAMNKKPEIQIVTENNISNEKETFKPVQSEESYEDESFEETDIVSGILNAMGLERETSTEANKDEDNENTESSEESEALTNMATGLFDSVSSFGQNSDSTEENDSSSTEQPIRYIRIQTTTDASIDEDKTILPQNVDSFNLTVKIMQDEVKPLINRLNLINPSAGMENKFTTNKISTESFFSKKVSAGISSINKIPTTEMVTTKAPTKLPEVTKISTKLPEYIKASPVKHSSTLLPTTIQKVNAESKAPVSSTSMADKSDEIMADSSYDENQYHESTPDYPEYEDYTTPIDYEDSMKNHTAQSSTEKISSTNKVPASSKLPNNIISSSLPTMQSIAAASQLVTSTTVKAITSKSKTEFSLGQVNELEKPLKPVASPLVQMSLIRKEDSLEEVDYITPPRPVYSSTRPTFRPRHPTTTQSTFKDSESEGAYIKLGEQPTKLGGFKNKEYLNNLKIQPVYYSSSTELPKTITTEAYKEFSSKTEKVPLIEKFHTIKYEPSFSKDDIKKLFSTEKVETEKLHTITFEQTALPTTTQENLIQIKVQTQAPVPLVSMGQKYAPLQTTLEAIKLNSIKHTIVMPQSSGIKNNIVMPQVRPQTPVELSLAPKEALGLSVSTSALDEDLTEFAKLCNDLAFSFWKSIISDGVSQSRSVVISPFAVSSMLSMLFLGARGGTSGEMNDLLKLDDMVSFNPHVVFRNITESVEQSKKSGIAAASFVRELYSERLRGKILPFFKEKAQQFYGAHVEEVNFNVVNDIIRRRTNLLVKRRTNGKINEYLKTNNIWISEPLAAISANVFMVNI